MSKRNVLQVAEGNHLPNLKALVPVEVGTIMIFMGQAYVATQKANVGDNIVAIKRGAITYNGRVNLLGLSPGYIGDVYATELSGEGAVVIAENVYGVSLAPFGFGNAIKIGVIESWHDEGTPNPSYTLNLDTIASGGGSGGDGIDEIARARAEEAYALAESALGQFPATFSRILDNHDSPFEIPAGQTITLIFNNGSQPGVAFDPANPTRIYSNEIDGNGGFYYVALTNIRRLTGAPITDLRVSIKRDGFANSGDVEDAIPQGGQVAGFMTFTGGVGNWREVKITNTNVSQAIELDDAGLGIASFRMAKFL